MTGKKLRNFILILVTVFFGLQFVSRLISSLGSRTRSPGLFKVAAVCFPFESEAYYRYGHAKSDGGKNEGISFLERALFFNPFDNRSHFDLGRATLSQRPLSDQMYRKGIDSLGRAVRSGGGKKTAVCVRVLASMLDYWVRLTDPEKGLCRKLLKNVIDKITPADFDAILGRWESSSRDVSIFEGALESAPRYYRRVAAALTRLEIEPELRRVFCVNHEIFTLEEVKEQYKKSSNRSPGLLERLTALRLRLKQEIPGYYKIVRNSKFKRQTFQDLLNRLNFHILFRYLTTPEKQGLPGQPSETDRFVLSCINDFHSGEKLEELYRFLERHGYFTAGGPAVSLARGRILFKMRDYAAVIAHLERARFSLPDPDVLFLLSESYISSRLLTRALAVLSGINDLTSLSSHSLMELYRQEMKIEYIIGPGASENEQRAYYYRLLNDSRRIELLEPSVERTVYLVNHAIGVAGIDDINLSVDEIEIGFGEGLKEKIKDRHLLQVFIDGDIRFETYLGQLDFQKSLKIKISPFERFAKHSIKVIII